MHLGVIILSLQMALFYSFYFIACLTFYSSMTYIQKELAHISTQLNECSQSQHSCTGSKRCLDMSSKSLVHGYRNRLSSGPEPSAECVAVHGLGPRWRRMTVAVTESPTGIPFNSVFTSLSYGFLWSLAPISE